MSSWQVNQIVETQAGFVAAGEAGKGPALVLAHGWPWSSFSWHRIIPALAQRFHLYWYDMPGYGRSSMADQSTSLDVQGRVFAEMLRHWDLNQPTVLAHDFGGATTLRAHLLHGCDFERLMLLNVVAVSPWGSDFFDHVGRHIDAFTGLPPHIHRALVDAYIGGAVSTRIDPEDKASLVEPWLSDEGRKSFYRQFAQADERYTDEIMHLYNQIRCPVDILWGADDPWIPLDRGRRLRDLISGSSFDELPNAGHLPRLRRLTRSFNACEVPTDFMFNVQYLEAANSDCFWAKTLKASKSAIGPIAERRLTPSNCEKADCLLPTHLRT